jgi:hypothetical protein
MIGVSGIIFFLFIGFNFAFHDDDGLRQNLWDTGNDTMSGSIEERFDNQMVQLSQGFGIAFIVLFAIGIVLFLVDVFSGPSREMY